MFSTPALGLPFEMLDRVRHVHVSSFNASLNERLIQDSAGRSHKRMACHVFLISRLLADEDDRSLGCSLPKHGLGGLLV
jgi:hypothetical protein